MLLAIAMMDGCQCQKVWFNDIVTLFLCKLSAWSKMTRSCTSLSCLLMMKGFLRVELS